MKIYSICIFKVNSPAVEGDRPVLLYSVYELSSFGFFQRKTVQERLLSVSRDTVAREQKDRVSLPDTQTKSVCHTLVETGKGLGCSIITDTEYPSKIVHSIVNIALDQFGKAHNESIYIDSIRDRELSTPNIKELIKNYQNPQNAMKLIQQLDQINEYVRKTSDTTDLDKNNNINDDFNSPNADISYDVAEYEKRAFQNAYKMYPAC